jgi:hypothetical protein
MTIKLINKTVRMNPATFKQDLLVTVKIDLELIRDKSALDPNFAEGFGKEFLSLLDSKDV